MSATPVHNTLVIAISSRALFDLGESHAVYTERGTPAYRQYQIDHENEVLDPGVAFNMVKKFLLLNQSRPEIAVMTDPSDAANTADAVSQQHVEIVLVSRNDADTGLRIFNSIDAHKLDITRAAFTAGQSPYPYLQPFGAHLFLSADPNDVRQAIAAGYAAATILPSTVKPNTNDQLKIAFDGDAVLFSDEAEQVFQQQGLTAFAETERRAADTPLPGGPFKPVLAALHRIQQHQQAAPIRTALITARGAPAHERVIKTLRAWKIRIDESFFLGGMDKGEFLKTFDADIFFDDQQTHCDSARAHVPTGHVPDGVNNPE